MKNAILAGLFIGILSGLWLFMIHWMGISPASGKDTQPIEYFSVLIPLIGLYFGIRSYRNNDLKGHMGFLEALVQSFKILLIGGVIAVAAAILYVDEFNGGKLKDFSGQIFGALLVGVLFSLGVSVLLTTKPNKVD